MHRAGWRIRFGALMTPVVGASVDASAIAALAAPPVVTVMVLIANASALRGGV